MSASDRAGNTTSASCSYRVVYVVQELYPDLGPNEPRSIARNTILPIAFRLVDAQGRGVTGPTVTAPSSVAATCPAQSAPLLLSLPGTAKTVNLGSGRWVAGWKAETSWRGTCRRVTVALGDGTSLTYLLKVV